MSLLATPREILTGRVTNIVIRSTTGGWTTGSPGRPIFIITGAAGDSIIDQVILDQFSAVIAFKSAQANASVQITDTKNNEACTVNVYGAAQFAATAVPGSVGRSAHDDNSRTADSRHNQTGR